MQTLTGKTEAVIPRPATFSLMQPHLQEVRALEVGSEKLEQEIGSFGGGDRLCAGTRGPWRAPPPPPAHGIFRNCVSYNKAITVNRTFFGALGVVQLNCQPEGGRGNPGMWSQPGRRAGSAGAPLWLSPSAAVSWD